MSINKKLFLVIPIIAPYATAHATGFYANNMSALNINMLTDTFIGYAHRGDNLSDFFVRPNLYGTMTRVDEYGDNGLTIPVQNRNMDNQQFMFKNIWGDIKHINSDAHYGNGINARARLNLITMGTETRDIDVTYGKISFGGFGGYINGTTDGTDSNGNTVGLFSHYKYRNFDTVFMINNGSINNDYHGFNFSNAWFDVMVDASAKFKIDENLYIRPGLYAGYTWVSSDNFYLNGANVSADNFSIVNIAPSVQVVRHIARGFYGALYAKYLATFGNDKEIYVNGIKFAETDMNNYTEIGTNLEYDYKHIVFTGTISKQIGGFDSWNGNINVKYEF